RDRGLTVPDCTPRRVRGNSLCFLRVDPIFFRRKACASDTLGLDVSMPLFGRVGGGMASVACRIAFFLFFCPHGVAADLDECRKMFIGGKYEECAKLAEEEIKDRGRGEEWPILLTESLLTVGRYPEAQVAVSNALQRYRWSIR